eukprot:scaffold76540_cov50-Cyclotella_meneghiniana.AAC.1
MNPRHSAKSSLKWPTWASQFNDFSTDIDQPTAAHYVIHYKTQDLQRRIVRSGQKLYVTMRKSSISPYLPLVGTRHGGAS